MNNKENESCHKTSINWYPGHMAKTKREIEEDLKLIDVVVEILDARIPISSQNPEIAKIIQNKKRIILLNKSDLANENENKKWIKYFNQNGISALIVDCSSGKGIENVLKEVENQYKEEMQKYIEKGRIGKAIRIMVLGIPNVGKSSFINRVSKRNNTEVGNKPGVTRKKQWIRLNNKIELLDTPGVLWPKFETEKIALNLAFTGTIKDEILETTEIAYNLVKYLYKNNLQNIMNRYKITKEEITDETTIAELIELIAKKRGAIVSGGNIDEGKIANIIINDFRTGKLGNITLEKVEEI